MTLNLFSKLLIYLVTLNIVQSFNVLDIYNFNSINRFFNDISTKVMNKYLFDKLTTENQKNVILNEIVTDWIGVLTKLDNLKSDFDDSYWPKEYYSLIRTFEIYDFKLNDPESHSSLIARTNVIEEKRSSIETYVKLIVSFQNSTELRNIVNLCPFIPKILEQADEVFHSNSIAEVFHELIDDISMKMKSKKYDICGQRSSLNEGWFIYYRQVMITFLKKMLMYYYVGVVNARCRNEQLSDAMKFSRSNATEAFAKSIQSLQQMQKINHYMYQCDNNSKKDENQSGYYELERMIQKIVVNERFLSTENSCKHNCKLDEMKDIANHTECQEFHDCNFIANDFYMCNEKEGNKRRYEWFKNRYGDHFGPGKKQKCHDNIEGLSNYFDISQMRYCDYCVCTCIAKPKKSNNIVTAISFRDQVTNIYQNMVVVGVRFVKKDYMIHIQIKERQLRRRGFNDSGLWKELENFDFNDQTGRFVVNNNNVTTPLHEGIDYGHPRIINFDDIIAPKGFVVTGVRLAYVENTLDYRKLKTKPIELQIRVTPFDYIQGMLINLHKTYWIAPKHQSHHLRKEVILESPDDSTKSSENLIDSQPNQFIKFRVSDLKKDAGQSTVPFFDASEAEGHPDFPFGGIGIIHRGQKGFGGFLAFKIYDLDLSMYFKS